jgi:hypothetical protein
MSSLWTEVEQALTPEWPLPPIEVSAAQLELELAPEELAAAGVSITAIEFFPVVVLLGMLAGASAWLRPQWKAATKHHHSLLWRVFTWPARKLEQGIIDLEHRVEHAISHWLAPKTRYVAHWLNSIAHITHQLSGNVGYLADATHEALVFLRHHVVPELIRDAVRPVVRAVDAIDTQLRSAEHGIRTQLATIGRAVGATFASAVNELAHVVVELYTYTIKTLAPQVQLLTRTVTKLAADVKTLTLYVYNNLALRLEQVETQVQTLTVTVTQLAAQLAPAVLAATALAAVRAAAPNLFCRNVTESTTQVCNIDQAFFDELLAFFGALAVFLSLEEYVRLMQGITRETTGVIHELLRV